MSVRTSGVAMALGARFRVPDAPALTAEARPRCNVTFTELHSARTEPFETGPREADNAFIVGVQLMDFPRFRFWEDGRQVPVRDLTVGDITLNDMRREARAVIDPPFHSIYCHVPFEAIEAVTGKEYRLSALWLRYRPGEGFQDPVMRSLLLSVATAISGNYVGLRRYADHAAAALIVHLMSRYRVRSDAG